MNDDKKDKGIELGLQGNDALRRQARRFRKKSAKRENLSDTGSVSALSETSRLLGSDGEGIRPIKMSKAKAMHILGLKGEPVPAQVHGVSQSQLTQHAPENEGNPRKYAEILAASEFLIKKQSQIVRQYIRDVEQFYRTFQTLVQPIQNKYYTLAQKGRDDASAKIKFIDEVGRNLQKLGVEYLNNLNCTGYTDEAFKKLNHDYYDAYQKIVSNLDKGGLDLNEQNELRKAIAGQSFSTEELKTKSTLKQEFSEDEINRRGLFVDLQTLHKHFPYGYNPEKEEFLNPIRIFKEQYDNYLGDILILRSQYPDHHDEVFTTLYSELESLGEDYMSKVQEEKEDIALISQDYATKFKQAVEKAKAGFAKEPGIWANLSPCLRGIFTVVFIIKYIISLAETKADSHRMYHQEKISIQERWARWQMDCMPQLDQQKMEMHKKH